MEAKNDWRLMNQETYLKSVTLYHRKYRQNALKPNWNHDHCAFCSAKFSLASSPELLKEGYATENDNHWICTQCYHDFKERFQWSVL